MSIGYPKVTHNSERKKGVRARWPRSHRDENPRGKLSANYADFCAEPGDLPEEAPVF